MFGFRMEWTVFSLIGNVRTDEDPELRSANLERKNRRTRIWHRQPGRTQGFIQTNTYIRKIILVFSLPAPLKIWFKRYILNGSKMT